LRGYAHEEETLDPLDADRRNSWKTLLSVESGMAQYYPQAGFPGCIVTTRIQRTTLSFRR